MAEFPCEGPIDANIHAIAGTVDVIAEQRSTVSVDIAPNHDNDASRAAAEATKVEFSGNSLVIQVPNSRGGGFMRRSQSLRITVHLPTDSSVEIGTASADVMMEGRFGNVTVGTASGDLRADGITGDFERDSASGDTLIGSITGRAKFETASGDVRVASVGGDLRIRAASADISVETVAGAVKINTASGDTEIGLVGGGDVSVNTASGDVEIGVAHGTGVWLDINTLSGDTRSELEMTDGQPATDATPIKIQVSTISGDVLIRRARGTDDVVTEVVDD